MIGEIILTIYDVMGRPTGTPVSQKHKRLFHGTFPMGRYISQPLTTQYSSVKEMLRFLRGCKYVSDKEQFVREDYWMPPEEFEKVKKGDCDDFALWTWRQLLGMGYNARYVVESSGKYAEGHAWVTMEKQGRHLLVEPLWFLSETMPRLSTVGYKPQGSVEWDGKKLHYFIHEKREFKMSISQIPILISEWVLFWIWFWLHFLWCVCLLPFLIIKKFVRKRLSTSTDGKMKSVIAHDDASPED